MKSNTKTTQSKWKEETGVRVDHRIGKMEKEKRDGRGLADKGRGKEIRLHGPSHRVLLSPFPRQLIVPVTIGLINSGNLGNERVVGIRVAQQGANRQQDFRNSERWTPLRSENIQANAAIRVDIRVIDAGRECNLGRFEGVISGEVNGEEEDSALVGRLGRTHDGRLPVEEVVADRTCRALCRGVPAEVLQLLLDSLQSHSV